MALATWRCEGYRNLMVSVKTVKKSKGMETGDHHCQILDTVVTGRRGNPRFPQCSSDRD